MRYNKAIFWITAGIVLILGMYASARSMMIFAGVGSASVARSVMIIPSPSYTDKKTILNNLNLTQGAPLYDYNLKDMQASVMSIPEIARADIKREPNGTIYVLIKEKVPVAIWFDGKNYYPLTRDGDVIDKPFSSNPGGLVFSGTKPRDVTGVIKAFNKFPEIIKKTKRIEFIEGRRWNIVAKSGAKIMLPEGGLENSLGRLSAAGVMDKKLSVIDLRDTNRILVR